MKPWWPALLTLLAAHPAISSLPPTRTADAAQDYPVTVRVTDADGDYHEQTFLLRVLPELVVTEFAAWAELVIPEPGQRAPGLDPDGDGLPNLLEYAFGLDPLARDSAGVPQVGLEGTRLFLRFPLDERKVDLIYCVEVGDSLAAIQTVIYRTGEPAGPHVRPLPGGRIQVTDTREVETARFMRVRVAPRSRPRSPGKRRRAWSNPRSSGSARR